MSRKLLVRSTVFGLTLTIAGVASARTPPALANAQARVDGIFATCPQGASTSGYRDMLTRFSSAARWQSAPSTATTAFTAPPQKMRDHVVLSCSGGTVHSGSGYRDMLWRFPADNARPVFAHAVRPATAQLVGHD